MAHCRSPSSQVTILSFNKKQTILSWKGDWIYFVMRKTELEACIFSPKFNNRTSKALHSSASLTSGIRVQSFPVSFCHDRRVKPISPNLCEFTESQQGGYTAGESSLCMFPESVSPTPGLSRGDKGQHQVTWSHCPLTSEVLIVITDDLGE